MRPGAVGRIVVVAGCGLSTMMVSACQSTEEESARIGRQSSQSTSAAGALKLGARNRTVHASQVTLLNSGGRLAVVAKLTSTSARAQHDVPILVTVTGRDGKALYSNEAGGLEPSLQRIALLGAHGSAWWVDDQVVVSGTATGARVRVGTGSRSDPSPVATPLTRGVHTSSQAGIATIAATLVNRSVNALTKVAVFGVALRSGRVVAAGRAVVAALAGRIGASVSFQIVLVGNPAGAKIELTAVPSSG
jgi:hypothetical protein